MADMLISHGFDTLGLRSGTVMTHHANPVTNGLVQSLGYVEYHREVKPGWANPGYAILYRLSRQDWLKRRTSQ